MVLTLRVLIVIEMDDFDRNTTFSWILCDFLSEC